MYSGTKANCKRSTPVLPLLSVSGLDFYFIKHLTVTLLAAKIPFY